MGYGDKGPTFCRYHSKQSKALWVMEAGSRVGKLSVRIAAMSCVAMMFFGVLFTSSMNASCGSAEMVGRATRHAHNLRTCAGTCHQYLRLSLLHAFRGPAATFSQCAVSGQRVVSESSVTLTTERNTPGHLHAARTDLKA